MLTLIKSVNSKIDDVTKYLLQDAVFGVNEVSVIRKKDKIIFCVPSQTNCRMGCTFCHLTGTSRPSKNLSSGWLVSVVDYLIDAENLQNRTQDLLISFMGVGEPLLNVEGLEHSIEALHDKHSNIRFGICTMMPSLAAMESLSIWLSLNKQYRVKFHLSVHGIFNREAIIKSKVNITAAIAQMQTHSIINKLPIEYHYTLVDGVNDSTDELMEFNRRIEGDGSTVKFLALSETNGCAATKLTEEYIRSLFPQNIVEFYDPPGRDIGSSCGMFEAEIYNS